MSEPARPRDRDSEGAKRLYEEYAYVLDFLPYGRPQTDRQRHLAAPTVQLLGESYFTLLEAELKPGASVAPHERVYVGKERREKVNRITGRIGYDDLTATAKAEIHSVIEEMSKQQEGRFVEFFNKAHAITPRMHALELLPGVGKKSMWQIIDEREKRPFESFKDIQDRTSLVDVPKVIARRIVDELVGEEKYRVFARTF